MSELNPLHSWERELYKVPKREFPDEWAERVIHLPEGASSIPGRLSFDWCPYVRQPLRDVVDPEVQEISLCWPTQTAKTLAGMCMNFYAAAVLKRPVLHVMPTQAAAEGICVERYQPILEASPELWRLVDSGKRKEMTVNQIRVGGIWMDFCGSKSPTELASRAKGVLNLDEIDKYDEWTGNEADPIELATERARTYWDRKIWKTSTPTTETKYIWRELLASTNERFNVPCPHCGEYQELVWGSRDEGAGGLKWPSDCRDPHRLIDERLAYYECAHCSERIEDAAKYGMNMDGVWAPKGTKVSREGEILDPPKSKRRRGYHLWAIYSPWLSFSEIASKFLDCFRDGRAVSGKLMNFTNSWRALPWAQTAQELKSTAISAVSLPYHRGEVPNGVLLLVVCVDIQEEQGRRYMFYTLRGWGQGGESWLINQGRADSWEEVANLFSGWYKLADGTQIQPRGGFIDCGYKTDEVYQFCLRTGAIAIKGSGQLAAQQRLSKVEVGGAEISRLVINTDYYKDKCHRFISEKKRWWVPSDVSDEYISQMTAEQKVQSLDKRTGRVKFTWQCVPPGAANHSFDTECYQLAGAELFQLQTLGKKLEDESEVKISQRKEVF